MQKYLEMLTYSRPSFTPADNEFCNRYLVPVFGKPDHNGNFVRRIGESRTMFAAHWDTVDSKLCRKQIVISDGCDATLAPNSAGDCLGADCTTGIWLILEMIAAWIPGNYVVFANEESGCHGSRAMADECPEWLNTIDHCISFDRKGTVDVITHQCGIRTASDEFAYALGDALALGMSPSDGGVYTDSNEFAHIIPECTNLAVGYNRQHTRQETQNLPFLTLLRDRLLQVDWQDLPVARFPDDTPPDLFGDMSDMESLIRDYPSRVAAWLECSGIDVETLKMELGV
jgi:hypothetical protein